MLESYLATGIGAGENGGILDLLKDSLVDLHQVAVKIKVESNTLSLATDETFVDQLPFQHFFDNPIVYYGHD